MTDLIWLCPKCEGSNDRLEAVEGRKKWIFFGKRETKLAAMCLDCGTAMDFVGTL